MAASTQALERMLAGGRDNALLRFGLGNAYLAEGAYESAITHLQRAVEFDSSYSAAWKMLGQALAAAGRRVEALQAYRCGMAAAEKKGDKQAFKEMQVFARRIERQLD